MKQTNIKVWLDLADFVADMDIEDAESLSDILQSTIKELTKLVRDLIEEIVELEQKKEKVEEPQWFGEATTFNEKKVRNLLIVKDMDAGFSAADIADKWGISTCRVYQIYKRYSEDLK